MNEDASLVARTLAGDQSAFTSLVDRYHSEVYHLAYRFLRRREDAEDLTQEAFLRAYRALSSFDPERPFGAWMYAITTRLCIDFHRRRRVKTVSLTRHEEGTAGEEREWEIADPAEGPEEQVEHGQEALRLEALVNRLPPDYRLAILLRHAHDFSYEEIAEATGAPLGTVKARIHRARAQLREWLEEREKEEKRKEGGSEGKPGTPRPESKRSLQEESRLRKSGDPMHPSSPIGRREGR